MSQKKQKPSAQDEPAGPKGGLKMDMKLAVAAILAVLALAIGAYIYLNQPQEPEKDPWDGREPAYMEDFADNLAYADNVYFVMDLRGADDETRTNIMQCVTDLAFSSALGGKGKEIYSLDTDCLKMGDAGGEVPATLALSQCLSEIDSARGDLTKSVFYVRKSNRTMVFDNELVIGINETYEYMACSISSETASAQLNVSETFVNQTWQHLTNLTTGIQNSENFTGN